ncbi:hypothetical protein TW82_11245 [Pseudoalteromonas fuliginea]|nr:hypothetical protein TW82_11245 [Pseudoalteromonas fuliginea]
MIENLLTWDIFMRCIIPLLVANIFFMALVYFSLVRKRFGTAYNYYVIFFITFIFYLCGPLLNALPIEHTKPYLQLGRTILFFWFGLPSLLVALFRQSDILLPHAVQYFSYAFGFVFSLSYLVLTDLTHPKINVLLDFGVVIGPFTWLVINHVYYLQVVAIMMLLILPCGYLLLHGKNLKNHGYIYSALCLGVVAVLGSVYQHWVFYYAGTSVCGLIWAAAIFKDIYITNNALRLNTAPASLFKPEKNHTLDKNKFINSSLLLKNKLKKANLIVCFGVVKSQLNKRYLASVFKYVNKYFSQVTYIFLSDKHLVKHNTNTKGVSVNEDVVRAAQRYIDKNYSKNINIDIIACAIGVSRSYLIKQFRQVTSNTINNQIIDIRIEKAKVMLLEKSVTETAFEVGFNNSNYFATVFKKRTNFTPRQFKDIFTGKTTTK